MRLTPTIISMIIIGTSYSQVGIGHETPKSDLHIAKTASDGGSIQIDGGIRLGGNNTTPGSKGSPGQVLVSNGSTVEWGTIGKTQGYATDCGVPNNIATINFSLPNGSNGNNVNVTSAQMVNALNSLPDGGIILLRTNTATVYSTNTSLTVNLPSAASFLNKPFVIAFDGPIGSNNFLNHNRNIDILVKATEANSFVYELGTVSTNRRYIINNFPSTISDYKVSDLDNNSGITQPILMLNSYTIQAIDDKTWSFTNRDCFILNPKN